jgi:hypothetical protein
VSSPAVLTLLDAERQAVAMAARHAVADRVPAVVYQLADRVVVLPATEPAPVGATVHCIAERWNATRIQIRRSGAWSDWVDA